MQVSRNSWLYWWAYLLTERWKRPQTAANLCNFFWRVVLLTPLKLLGVTMVALAICTILFEFIKFCYAYPKGLAVVLTPIVIGVGIGWIFNHGPLKRDGLVRNYISAVKKRWCPLIEITWDDTHDDDTHD